jgi:ABC-type Fe3+-hydroxamate transport system substrate-binding protein
MRARRGRIIRSRVDLPQQEVWSRFLIALLLLAIAGCASVEKTTPETAETYLDRAQTQTQGPIRVIATVPSAKETRKLFGEPLYRRNVQPVWLEIENKGTVGVSFLPIGVDPLYYSPTEAVHLSTDGRQGVGTTARAWGS